MNDLGLIIKNTKVVVGSRKVADVFQKRHDHVLRDIENIMESLPKNGDTPVTSFYIPTTYINPQNKQEYPECLLTRDGFTLLTMGYTGEKAMKFKVAYINEFNRMEQKLTTMGRFQVPTTLPEALRMAADLAEENQKLLPKAKGYDRFLDIEGIMTMNQAAKTLNVKGIGQNKLFQILREEGVFYKNGKDNLPYQEYINRGYFEVKQKALNISDSEVLYSQIYVTPKGLDWIYKLLIDKGYVEEAKLQVI